ncbi:uncharacterized protein LOC119593317 [Penaeus monodon]|uniref:uncharacterized protein LOC119593317 n=1 Tax=Penaeus monodon TaxID=6687 RepID=UPI0018A7BE9E|nr:uncharacterized protein LOC119593317 [Penaeus monodon]
MAKYALSAILLATTLLHLAASSASPSAPSDGQEDDPRLIFGTGTGNSVTFDNEAIISAIMFFIMGAALAFFAYGYVFPTGRPYAHYDDLTGYSNYGPDHTYTVHRSIDNAAKKYKDL